MFCSRIGIYYYEIKEIKLMFILILFPYNSYFSYHVYRIYLITYVKSKDVLDFKITRNYYFIRGSYSGI